MSDTAEALKVRNFSVWHKGRPGAVLRGDAFVLRRSCVTGLLGGNGAGKTTFIRMLSGLLPTFVCSDFISLGKRTFPSDRGFKISRMVVFTDDRSFPLWTFRDLLLFAQKMYGVSPSAEQETYLVEGFGFQDHLLTPFRNLSSGNSKKARLIVALLIAPPIIILDEPTDFLDFIGTEFLYEQIIQKRNLGHSILMSSHITESFIRCADEIFVAADHFLSGPVSVPEGAQGIKKLIEVRNE